MISCIVAVDKSQGVGFNDSMPWPTFKEDLSWFKKNHSQIQNKRILKK